MKWSPLWQMQLARQGGRSPLDDPTNSVMLAMDVLGCKRLSSSSYARRVQKPGEFQISDVSFYGNVRSEYLLIELWRILFRTRLKRTMRTITVSRRT